MSPKQTKILFVCMGNICRSPALAATFKKLAADQGVADKFVVDSCGLTSWFLGQAADARIVAAAEKLQIPVAHRSHILEDGYFQLFDFILATDKEILRALQALAPNPQAKAKIHLATHFSKRFPDQNINDPYYEGGSAFGKVMEMAVDACQGLLDHLKQS